jgi:hypothetical protein
MSDFTCASTVVIGNLLQVCTEIFSCFARICININELAVASMEN